MQGHDLLSLLINSNIAADMPESMRMGDSEILSRECPFRFLRSVFCSKTMDADIILPRDTDILACRP